MLSSLKLPLCFSCLGVLTISALSLTSSENKDAFEFDSYRGLKSVKSEATGFFRLENIGERSVFITPEGHGYLALGINHISSIGFPNFKDEPFTTQYGRDWNRFWNEHLGPQLANWNVTSFGYGGPTDLQDKLPFFATIGIAPIEKHRSHPDTSAKGFFRFPDVFDPAWQEKTTKSIRHLASQHKDDPFLIGYLWTDTPTWSLLETRALRGTDWVTEIRRLPADAPGRKAYADFLLERYANRLADLNQFYGLNLASLDELATADLQAVAIGRHRVQEDDEAFLPKIAETYYKTAGEALREAAPNHLNFGDRYLAGDAPAGVLLAAKPYIDAVAVQPGDIYSRLYPPSTKFPEDAIEHLYQVTGKPVLICDHAISFPTPDHPRTIFEQKPSKEEAIRATQDFLQASFSKPYILGYLRCQYVDRPAGFGRGLRQGLVKTDGTTREKLVEVYRDEFRNALESLSQLP
ncbi:MAG: hypothetical protein AAGA58_13735 [Verrucomicrobiota bacterium]